ncbi:ParB N-terminal domain-containing protein [Ideonella sp. B508-1]|uniref:ParB N-terminal domain-containing protein n=1 Tax=Ideonella sp. B508-1 TaxID=137716 RepID=UPI0011D2B432|nr:ParB N-terminal domain-containing protein [Ideonella sp. B508-1]
MNKKLAMKAAVKAGSSATRAAKATLGVPMKKIAPSPSGAQLNIPDKEPRDVLMSIRKKPAMKAIPKAKPHAAPAVKVSSAAPSKRTDSSRSGPKLDIPDGESQEIEPARLLLDPYNLRLLEQVRDSFDRMDVSLLGQPAVQEKLQQLIVENPRYDVDALVKSISNNGFLRHERIVVAKYDGDKFLVLEGNRRLTAVRQIYEINGQSLTKMRARVRESLMTLPCLVLTGPVIGRSKQHLDDYRRDAEVYIGMRHLMGTKDWDPASRYEFLSRLIFEEGWSVLQIAEHFGRKKSEVIRDLKAQTLYRDFVAFERRNKIEHTLTYNAFAEAARAPAIANWLGWSDRDVTFSSKKNEEVFFHYLIAKLPKHLDGALLDDEGALPEASAELAVRRLRDMLKLGDSIVEEALADREFKSAEILFESRREGALTKKLSNFTNALRRVSSEELLESSETERRLNELRLQIDRMLKIIRALQS